MTREDDVLMEELAKIPEIEELDWAAKRIEELRPWKVRIKLKNGQVIFEPLEIALSKLREMGIRVPEH
jgi:hypothetical protein